MNAIVSADAINREHELAHSSAATAIKHAIRCGELLTAMKAEIPHGEFMGWIAANCKFSQASANNYMKAARNPSVIGNSIRHLFPSGRAKPAVTHEPEAAAPKEVPIAVIAQPKIKEEQDLPPGWDSEDDPPERKHRYEDITTCWRWKEASKPMQDLVRSFHLKSRHERGFAVQLLVDLLDLDQDRYEWLLTKHQSVVPGSTDGLLKRIEQLENENEGLRERIAIMEEA